MSKEQWTLVDQYIDDLFVGADPALEAALVASTAAGLPAIAVSPAPGKLLQILATAIGAFSRSARSAATARSGWRGRCRPTAA